jgi:hypothetical protein
MGGLVTSRTYIRVSRGVEYFLNNQIGGGASWSSSQQGETNTMAVSHETSWTDSYDTRIREPTNNASVKVPTETPVELGASRRQCHRRLRRGLGLDLRKRLRLSGNPVSGHADGSAPASLMEILAWAKRS